MIKVYPNIDPYGACLSCHTMTDFLFYIEIAQDGANYVETLSLCTNCIQEITRQNRKKTKTRGFDKSNILTCVTTDKAKVGMRGYFGITIRHIENNIKKGNIDVLSYVEDNKEYLSPFKREDAEHFPLFYPIDEVEE